LSFIWSEEAVELLRALHAQGFSGAELASRLGGGLTRSAVFGKLHRLGLTGRKRQRDLRPSPARIGDEAILAPGGDRGQSDHSGGDPGRGPMKFNFARKGGRASAARGSGTCLLPPPSLGIDIVAIGEDQCRFIAGDDGLACGHPVAKGSRWCPAHHAMVFVAEAA
jgi:hypothetical protein